MCVCVCACVYCMCVMCMQCRHIHNYQWQSSCIKPTLCPYEDKENNEWMHGVFVCSYAHVSNVCVFSWCILDNYLILYSSDRWWSISSLGSSFDFVDFRPEYLPSALSFVFTIHHHCHTVSHKQQITMPMHLLAQTLLSMHIPTHTCWHANNAHNDMQTYQANSTYMHTLANSHYCTLLVISIECRHRSRLCVP